MTGCISAAYHAKPYLICSSPSLPWLYLHATPSSCLTQVTLARGRVYTAPTSTGFQLQLTTKHKSSQVPSFQMQLSLMKATTPSQPGDNMHTIKPELLHQHSMPSQSLPSIPVSPSPQSGYHLPSTSGSPQPLAASPVQPSQPPNYALSSPSSPLIPPQASVGDSSVPPLPSRPPHAANGSSQTNAQRGCDNRTGNGAAQSHANPAGTVYFSHCLHEKRHITEATSGFTCFACKQRCKGLLVRLLRMLFSIQISAIAGTCVSTQPQLPQQECASMMDGPMLCMCSRQKEERRNLHT